MTETLINKFPEGILSLIPGSDAFATKAFYGIVTGKEIYECRNSVDELRKLVLKRLEAAHKEAVNQVESIK